MTPNSTVNYLLATWIALLGAALVSADDSPIDFKAQVMPLLRDHCLTCHSADEHKGGLRLDSKEQVLKGGHTGLQILSKSLDGSELYQRIISDDERYRMPMDAPPLSDADKQVFKRWLEAGSPWPETPLQFTKANSAIETWMPGVFYDPFKPYIGHFRILGIPFVVFLLLTVLIARAKKRQARNTELANGKNAWLYRSSSKLSAAHFVVGLLMFLLAGLWLYHRGTLAEVVREKDDLDRKLKKVTFPSVADEYKPKGITGPYPHRPKHPKRLSGTYYRGNNERDYQLFNGGFYRTATLHLALCNGENKPLAYGDKILGGPLSIRFQIERARNATHQLFRNSIMESTFLSAHAVNVGAQVSLDDRVQLAMIEEGERWEAYYPIELASDAAEQELSGMVYVYNGSADGSSDGRTEEGYSIHYHYGIRYDLKIKDGALTRDSEVWLGSLFKPSNLYIPLPPAPKWMTDDEWFDFREIPEIEGENTKDLKLLGVDDYDAKKIDPSITMVMATHTPNRASSNCGDSDSALS